MNESEDIHRQQSSQENPTEVLTEISEEQKLRDALGLKDIAHKYLEDENKALKKKINDLTILIYQVLDQDDNDFFDDNVRLVERQNIRRILKAKFPLTAEQVDIVNKNKEQLQQNSTNS